MQYRHGNSERTTRSGAPKLLTALLAMIAMLAAACGEDGATGENNDLSGRIVVSGSSTVEPISIGVAEKFGQSAPGVDISVDGPGTGDGFELFCQGETDISDASRAITQEEIAACEEAGVEFIELKVAIDGIAVLTSPANENVSDCLSYGDIYALVGPESQGFDQWSDANALATEIGDSKGAPFPEVQLAITGPGEESGTYDSFVELVLEDFAEERGQEPQTRPDYQASADDNVIIQGITGSDTSFGWVGYAFYDANRERVKAFEVAGDGGECVAPTAETIGSGDYPISRPLFIYVNTQKLEDKPALEQYVDLYLSEEGLATVSEVGYIDLNEEELEATIEAWNNRTTGTREG